MVTRVAVVLLATAIAHADNRVAVMVGAGPELDHYRDAADECLPYGNCVSGRERFGAAVTVHVGARASDKVSVGFHVGVAQIFGGYMSWYEPGAGSCCPITKQATGPHTPLRFGASIQYAILDRVWLGSWIGAEDGGAKRRRDYSDSDKSDPAPIFGLYVGVDLGAWNRHRLGSYVQIANTDEHTYVSTGVAYRY